MMVPRSQKISVASMMLDDALSKFQKEVKITGDDAQIDPYAFLGENLTV